MKNASKNARSKMLLDEVNARIKAVTKKEVDECDLAPVGEGDEEIGVVPEDHRPLYAAILLMASEGRSLQRGLDVMSSPEKFDESMRKVRNIAMKCEAVSELFWTSLRIRLEAENLEVIGVREGWKVVSKKVEPIPSLPQEMLSLFGIGSA